MREESKNKKISDAIGELKKGEPDDSKLFDMKEMMYEIDSKVKRLSDIFSFLLTYQMLFRGTGLEFAQLKEYIPGEDDATKIDWKSSLRTGKIFIKQYEEERDLDIVVLLDVSSSMNFGTQKRIKREYAGIIAGAIISAGIQIGDNVGFCIYSDEVIKFLEPSNDESQYYRSLELIIDKKNYGGKADLDKALRFVLNNVKESTILFLVSDFISTGKEWEDSIKMVSNKLNDVMGFMVRDLRDEFLPEGSGNFRFKDPHTEKTIIVNLDKAKKKYEEMAKEQSDYVKKIFRSSNTGFVKVFTHEPFVKALVKELTLRRVL